MDNGHLATVAETPLAGISPSHRDHINVICKKLYFDHVYYDMPVLSLKSLTATSSESATTLGLSPYLYTALIASCMPWLPQASIALMRSETRQKCLQCCVEVFGRLYHRDIEEPLLVQLQSLLLMIYAVSHSDTRESRYRRKQWIRESLQLLPRVVQAHREQPQKDGHGRTLLNRLRWSTFVTEQLYFLRVAETDGSFKKKLPRFALVPLDGEEICLDDFELNIEGGPDKGLPAQWSRMTRARSFIHKTRLLRHQAQLLSKVGLLSPPPDTGSDSCALLVHDEYFWTIQALEEMHTRERNLASVFPSITDKEHDISWRLEAENHILYDRIMLLVCCPNWRPRNGTDNDSIWARLLFNKLQQSICGLSNISETFGLSDLAPSCALFHALIESAHCLRSNATASYIKKWMAQGHLRDVLHQTDQHWNEHISREPLGSKSTSAPPSCQYTEEVMTDVSKQLEPSGGVDPYFRHDSIVLAQQNRLLDGFENMWNMTV